VRLPAFAATLLVATSASANGRFPAANQLVVEDQRVVVRTTFGLLQSLDGGKTWGWICEERVGFSGTFDPAVALARGKLLAGLPDGLSTSADGCTFARAGKPLDREIVVDLAGRDPIVAVTAVPDPSIVGFRAFVARSTDATTWSIAPSLLPEDLQPTTIEIAPSRSQRLYVAGVGPFKRFATVARSDDGGATWTESTFDMGTSIAPYLAAVESDPDRVWLRFDGDEADTLLLSKDGGIRFDEVRKLDQLLGFALSPDGSRVAIGGPNDGLWIASTTDLSFAKVNALRVRCLTWTKSGLWACGDDEIVFSSDEGKTFASRLRFADLQPLACVKPQCDSAWADISKLIAPADAGTKPDAAIADAPIAEPTPQPGTSCGCGMKSGSPSGFVVLALLILLRRNRAQW
jgi:hypothetical protein